MSILFDSFFNFSFSSVNEKLSLIIDQQRVIAKIVVAILSACFGVYLCLKLEDLRQRVTVIDVQGNVYFSHIKNVNGKKKVIFNGFFASNVEASGEFKNGQLNGFGAIIFPSGMLKEEGGIFKEGWLMTGKKIYRDEKIEEGKFNKSFLEGSGMRIYPNGIVEKGVFKNGELLITSSKSYNT